jgi:hypothetical protein
MGLLSLSKCPSKREGEVLGVPREPGCCGCECPFLSALPRARGSRCGGTDYRVRQGGAQRTRLPSRRVPPRRVTPCACR